jgi:Flp pilus assembly protein TadD/TolB-like protein
MPPKAQDDDLVMSLVEMALAKPAGEREAYLQSACSGDLELFSQVWNYVESEQRMNGFLLDPLYPQAQCEHPFEPGELLDGRFRIVREVAQGGMGIVYEAMDEKLDRRIALKCAKVGFRKRLPPEVRNASEISHPNVCKIFEIHTASTQQGEVDFLTMEFLDGQTLAERLQGGPLPEAEARTIARQLCAGLAEAHRNGVIHGDLKSNNVILTTGADRALRAVITDFGLARRPEAAQRTTQSGALGGTPDYMAPELWKGEKASIASDIYALGVILCEVSSSRRPYGPEAPLKPQAVNLKWDPILRRCLDPDPARRYRDADEVALALAPPRTRRWLLGTAAAAVLAAGSGVVTYQAATAPQESVRLAILPFEAGPGTAPLAERLSRDASDQLARLKGGARARLSFVPLSKAVRDKVDTTEKARTALGATHVLHGTLTKENEKVILHAYLTDARSRVNAKDWTVEYSPSDVRYAPVALAGMVTGTLRLPLVAATAAVNAAARNDYQTGLSHLYRNSGADTAIALLERAVASDPDSALTYAGLAEAYFLKYFLTKEQLPLDRATESVRQAERRSPDVAQVHRIAGSLMANKGWYEQAAAEFRRAIEMDPGNGEGYMRLGKALQKNNQLDEALAAYRRAIEVEPQDYRNHQQLGDFYNKLANYSEAAKHFRRAVELIPDDPDPHFALGTAYMNLGQFGEAENELRHALDLGETPTALINLARALMYQGKDAEAIPYLNHALSRWPEKYLWRINLAICYRRINLKAESEAANRRGLELAEKELARNPRNGRIRSQLAYLCASLGDRWRAESEIAQALQLSPNEAGTQWMAVATYEALGQRDKALAVLSASPREVVADVSRYPDLADLHRDSRFKQLLASRQVR